MLERRSDYVHQHIEVLAQALLWQDNQKNRRYLLVGKERQVAEDWLLTQFLHPHQPPCRLAVISEYC